VLWNGADVVRVSVADEDVRKVDSALRHDSKIERSTRQGDTGLSAGCRSDLERATLEWAASWLRTW